MKTKLITILAIIFSAAFFSSCTEEEINPLDSKEQKATGSTDVDSF